MTPNNKWFVDLMILETEMKVRNFKESTIELYQKLVEEFLNYVDKNTFEIEAKDVEDYLQFQLNSKHNKKNTVMIRLNAIEFFLSEALGLKVTHKIQRYAREYEQKELLTREEVNSLFHGKISTRSAAIYALAYYLGLGSKEIATLNEDDYICESDGSASLILRSEDEIRVFNELVKELRELLEVWLMERNELLKYKDEKALFINKNYTRITSRSIDRWFKDDLKTVKITKKASFTVLKYSRAYEMAQYGQYKEAAEFLGYKDKDRLFRYFREIGIYVKPKSNK